MRILLLLIMSICTILVTNGQDSLILKAFKSTGDLRIYSDSNAINTIGVIEKGRPIYLLSPGSKFYYYVYGSGLVGYGSTNLLEFEIWNVNKLTNNNLEWKIKEAKRMEIGEDYELKRNEIRDSIQDKEKTKKFLASGLKDEIQVFQFDLTGDDYKTGFKVTFANFRKPSIKYVRLSVNGYNDVNDLEATKTFKCVGPIEYVGSGSYAFEDAFYSRVITKLKITKLSIDYMDGSHREFVGSELKKKLTYLTFE